MYQQIIDFWFKSIEPSSWWEKNLEFDRKIAKEFGSLHSQAIACELYEWRSQSYGRLAEIIILDQFSRNIFRDTPQAFAYDSLALALAQEAIRSGVESRLSAIERSFVYLPYMHSESRSIHKVALELYEKNGIENNLEFEKQHKAIIDRFGRYPHRNEILGRVSTEEEIEFLKQPNSSF